MTPFQRTGLYSGQTFKLGSFTKISGGEYASTPTVTLSNGNPYPSSAGWSISMNTASVYPGPVSSIGGSTSGYYAINSSLPSISFNPTGATGSLEFGTGRVVALQGIAGAYVNTQSPTITISGGGGSGATVSGTPQLPRKLFVTGVNISSAGSGYSVAPTVVFTRTNPPGISYVTDPVATAVISGGQVVGINITTQGQYIVTSTNILGYSAYSVSLTGGNGSGATVNSFPTLTPTEWYLYASEYGGISVSNGGSGYTSNPSISISGLLGGSVTPIVGKQILNIQGSGGSYTSQPTVTISGGTPLGNILTGNGSDYWNYDPSSNLIAYISSVTTYGVNSITVTSPGSNYKSTPTVNFTGGSPYSNANYVANLIPEYK